MARDYVLLVVLLSLLVGPLTLVPTVNSTSELCRGNMRYSRHIRHRRIYEPLIEKEVFCDTHFGYIYIQRRLTGKENFDCRWGSYVHGFGDIGSDHWLGLHAIHVLTYSGKAELVIRVFDNGKYYDLFVSGFKVKGFKHFYQMTYDKIERGSLSHEAFERSNQTSSCVTEDAPVSHIKTCYTDQTQRLDINKRKRLSGGAVGACQVKLKKGMTRPGGTELNKQDLVGFCNSDQILTSNRAFNSLSLHRDYMQC
ncbi:hypothetical protein RRG08_053466 [Elysia crispata]|uniref:Fibrinogen C-terminal domain-containing protein n=1 Tax=Elysia crispata TaxID=231223 RepID=A0AAE1CJ80_9GAST|nr:hypothetical protein RRG08_053466 [Elysia crispata]